MTATLGQQRQESPGQDYWGRIAGTGQLEQDSWGTIARTGQPGQDSERRQLGQYIQDRKQRTRLPGQDSKVSWQRTSGTESLRQGSRDRSVWTG
jgi:hypothetical protein